MAKHISNMNQLQAALMPTMVKFGTIISFFINDERNECIV